MRLFSSLALTLCLHGLSLANPADLIRQGDECDRKFQAAKALEYYLPAEKATPDDADLLVKIARQYVYRMDDLKSADDQLQSCRTGLSYAERAVKLAPTNADTHLAVAICLGKLTGLVGNKEAVAGSRKIKEAAETAVRLNPNNDYAWHMLGRWHQGVAGIGGVTRTLAKVIYGEIPDASFEEAAKCFEKARVLNRNRLIHVVELGRTYALMGRKDEARSLITQGLAMKNTEKDDPGTKARGRATLAELGS
jgi:tetratricopeptide (TPR) repeat protein